MDAVLLITDDELVRGFFSDQFCDIEIAGIADYVLRINGGGLFSKIIVDAELGLEVFERV